MRHKLNIKSHFLDSGAFSLKKDVEKFQKETGGTVDEYYNSAEFWKYVDNYAAFIKKYKLGIDLYANIDVIANPKLTWRNQKYLEEEHGLKPMPVVHFKTDVKWLKRYIDFGYKFIGLGGLANIMEAGDRSVWLDLCFDVICDTPNRLPKIKAHGFGVSSIKLWLKYPWWSIDSTSIHKKAAYGWILVPFYKNKQFLFTKPPMHISVSKKSPLVENRGRHFSTLAKGEKDCIVKWLKYIRIPVGGDKHLGVVNDGAMRSLALFRYYEVVAKALPTYPWPFTCKRKELLI